MTYTGNQPTAVHRLETTNPPMPPAYVEKFMAPESFDQYRRPELGWREGEIYYDPRLGFAWRPSDTLRQRILRRFAGFIANIPANANPTERLVQERECMFFAVRVELDEVILRALQQKLADYDVEENRLDHGAFLGTVDIRLKRSWVLRVQRILREAGIEVDWDHTSVEALADLVSFNTAYILQRVVWEIQSYLQQHGFGTEIPFGSLTQTGDDGSEREIEFPDPAVDLETDSMLASLLDRLPKLLDAAIEGAGLSPQERVVMQGVRDGKSDQQIAAELSTPDRQVSVSQVRVVKRHAFIKIIRWMWDVRGGNHA